MINMQALCPVGPIRIVAMLTKNSVLRKCGLAATYYYWRSNGYHEYLVLHQYWEDSTAPVLGDSTMPVLVSWYLVLSGSTQSVLASQYW